MEKTADGIAKNIKGFFKKVFTREGLRAFFMSKWYPVWIMCSVLLGYYTGIEMYLAMFDLLLLSAAFLVCDTMRPVLPVLLTFLYRISIEHAPGEPYIYLNRGDTPYIFSGWRPYGVLVCFAVFLGAFVYFAVKHRIFKGFGPKTTPLFAALIILSLGFIMGGAFSGKWVINDLYFALLQALCFAIVFWLLYYGLKMEKADELLDYVIYVCAIISVILLAELARVYKVCDVISSDGAIQKWKIMFGWGIHNTGGSAMSVLVPMCMLGAIRSKKFSYLYFAIATITLGGVWLTNSRSAMLVGTVAYIVSLIVCCVKGEKRKIYRIVIAAFLVLLAAAGVVFKDKIVELFRNVINNGFDDSSRFPLYERAFAGFKDSPIFGNGYFSYYNPQYNDYKGAEFVPMLAHSTPAQLIYSMGGFGILAYATYRVFTFVPFVKKMRTEKLMLLCMCATLVGESLIDNFIFWFSPTFLYNVAIVLAFMYRNEEKAFENNMPAVEGNAAAEELSE